MSATVGAPSWVTAVGRGLYRSAVLVGLSVPIPAVAIAVGYFGARVALSWGWAGSGAPGGVRVAAAAGELLLALCWSVVATGLAVIFVGRALAQRARQSARIWFGTVIDVSYRPVPAVTRMATGFWWNGFEYYRSQREARHDARLRSQRRDPQARRDLTWLVIAAVAVLPVAAAPFAAIGEGVYLVAGPGALWAGVLLIVTGLVASAFAWRIHRPMASRFLGPPPRGLLDQRLRDLEAVRADMTQTQAAEMERIERDLHDGAQARMVALGMSLGAAERLLDSDPEAVRAILAEARASAQDALAELRRLVRGINPPVLAERGLVDALHALALDAPVEVTVEAALPSRLERAIEAGVYFAVAELLTNAAKHARATHAEVKLSLIDHELRVSVTDDGAGGAVLVKGAGLDGIRRRMAALEGRIDIQSPPGGPTVIDLRVPCESS